MYYFCDREESVDSDHAAENIWAEKIFLHGELKMNPIILLKCLCLGLFCTSQAQASCNSTACDNEYISELRVEAAGYVVVNTTGNESLLGCTLYAGSYMVVDMTDSNADEVYAMLLSAQSTGKPIARIRIVSTSNPCKISYVYQSS